MLFNSIDFLFFIPLVFIAYWFVFNKNLKAQNLLIVICSYIFYGWWEVKFLTLIILSTLIDYTVGLLLDLTSNKSKRKIYLAISLISNLGILFYFKYYNFFISNFIDILNSIGINSDFTTLKIILPVGISFYTFQTLSYSIDVYRGNLKATKNIIAFAAFVSFFPQLVAGPIERATNLLPQFYRFRHFDYNNAIVGMRQILWGFLKKIVIADNCAVIANQVFNNSDSMNSSSLILGAIFFTFQIYGDFSGYSDIAIGLSRLFGFNLMQNFAFPYFSRDIAEFWRRWHISLSTWFRDYLYIPLGGSRGSKYQKIQNTFIIFLASGFWHGANWTFIIWGLLNALYFLPLQLTNKNRVNLQNNYANSYLPNFRELRQILFTFILTVFAWIFFRSDNVSHAFKFIKNIFSKTIIQIPNIDGKLSALITLALILVFVVVEWFNKSRSFGMENIDTIKSTPLRWGLYFMILSSIYLFGNFGETVEFIYFQF